MLVSKKYVKKKGSLLIMTHLGPLMLIEMLIAAITFPPWVSHTLTLDNEWEETDYELDHIILILMLIRVY